MKIDDMGQNVIPAKAGIQRGEGEGSAIFISSYVAFARPW